MNKININNIFTPNIKLKDFNNKKEQCLNVNNLVKNNVFENFITDEFLIDKIKNNKKIDSYKLNNLYQSIYIKCLNNINNHIDTLNDYLVFNVDLFQYGYEKYSSFKCLEYIKQKLDSVGFYSNLLSETEIFISWKFINDL
jgi:hypothetical protein